MKTIWAARMNQAAVKYGDHAPTVAVCCNVCRTCVSTNVIALAWAAVVGAALAIVRIFRRPTRPPIPPSG